LFLQWFEKSVNLLANFSILPYKEEKGHQITSTTQIPDDADFFAKYYHNHWVLQHGNLTGMIHFQTRTPWISLKSFKSPYFTWLKNCKVYLNQTKFKTDTLVACGFLVGAHPGHLRRDEVEEELKVSLGMDQGPLPFQLSSRSISVPIKDGDPSRYSFQAIVVETSTQYAPTIRETFYELDNRVKAKEDYPYTGMYQFVPLLKTKEWPLEKIYKLAQLHVNIVEGLRPIFIANLQDINHIIDDHENSLMQGFYGIQTSSQNHTAEGQVPASQLIHSIHNTSKQNTKVFLTQSSKYEEALDQFSNIYNILRTNIGIKYHSNVFVPGAAPI
jgi:hypothetical protein